MYNSGHNSFYYAYNHTIYMFTIACIPAFNESQSIRKTVLAVSKFVDSVIVCDDGSSDNTITESESVGAYVIRHQRNMGKGEALKSLFKFARVSNADIMITIDADGQFLPEEIPKMIKPISEQRADIVIGYRFDNSTEMPKYRKIGNNLLDKITNLATDLPFRDTQSGFRAYSKNAVMKIEFHTSGFGADSEILVDAVKKKLIILEEKVTVIYNTGGRTSTKNPIIHTGEVISSLVEQIAIKHPLKYIGIPGIALIIISIINGVNLISLFNETRYFSIPLTMISLGTLIVGAMFLLIAILLYSNAIMLLRKK